MAIRHAGGGGRPGGKPTFSWKQKFQLRLDSKQKKKVYKSRPFGDFQELEEYIDPTRGDAIYEISDGFTEPEMPKGMNNQYKVIDVTKLYGSDKPYGQLTRDRPVNSSPFSKRRMSKGRPL